MPVLAVVFDIGGVLEITPPTGWREAWQARLGAAWEEGIPRLESLWRAGSVGDVGLLEVEQQTAQVLGLGEADLRQFMDELWTEYLGELNRELADYFAALRPRYKTAILSNSFVGARERERQAYGFEDLCDLVVYSHEEGLEKPDPAFFAVVTGRLDVAASEVLFLDDVEAYVEAARLLGMTGVLYLDNGRAIAELESYLER
ncbi:MAG: HAD family hydrolase [Acidimicrobiales bacterium]